MRDGERDTQLDEQGVAKGPRKNHGDVNEELVPGAPRSPIREEREEDPRERPAENG
jgi:hypothetical protein